ncbi:MAG: hypothetical protein JWQ98_1739 [Chlorobi bacterium]|nr:hypothetical protein [Chlorobiota bacterium]
MDVEKLIEGIKFMTDWLINTKVWEKVTRSQAIITHVDKFIFLVENLSTGNSA